jgi:hypothetical protein
MYLDLHQSHGKKSVHFFPFTCELHTTTATTTTMSQTVLIMQCFALEDSQNEKKILNETIYQVLLAK